MEKFKLPSEISLDRWPAPEVFIEEARECVQAAREKGIVIRVMGGLAIYLHSQNFKDLWEKRFSPTLTTFPMGNIESN